MVELANIIWKRCRRGDVAAEWGRQIGDSIADPNRFEVDLVATRPLISSALQIATEFARSVYDALYLAAALELDAQFVTADERLVNAMASSPEWRDRIALLSSYSGGP